MIILDFNKTWFPKTLSPDKCKTVCTNFSTPTTLKLGVEFRFPGINNKVCQQRLLINGHAPLVFPPDVSCCYVLLPLNVKIHAVLTQLDTKKLVLSTAILDFVTNIDLTSRSIEPSPLGVEFIGQILTNK